jgi:hypothetical protein
MVLSAEWAWGKGEVRGTYLYPRMTNRFDSVEHQSLVLGLERTRAGAGVGPYIQGGLGFGRLTTEVTGWRAVSDGVAISGGMGLLFAPDPGPLGLVLGLRTSHLLGSGARSHAIALTLGLTIRPR